jgi:cytochrome oxidase assembly protein ShyY1
VSWRFAYSPKWIIRHVLVVLLVTTMILLMFWQLGRLHDKRAFKSLAQHRQEEPAAPVQELLPPGLSPGAARVADVLYRNATAEGTYLADRTFTVENRTDASDSPGAWVLTPLELGGNRAVVVNRGFIGYDVHGKIVAPAPPTGKVRVTGLVFPSQTRGFFGAKDPKAGVLTVLARVDLARVAAQVDGEVLPAYLQMTTSQPAEPPAPKGTPAIEALGPPDISEGPHLSYAVQWAIFSTIAAGGYVLLLRKVALQQGKEQALAAAGPPSDAV